MLKADDLSTCFACICSAVKCKDGDVLVIDCFDLVAFSIDSVVSRTAIQLLTCVLNGCEKNIECVIVPVF